MEAEKKKVEENQDNIINKIYDYYCWEKNEKPKEEKVFVICANDLQKFKDYIKYKDLKDYMDGKNPIINCIQQFYEEKKINIKYSEDNKNICIKIKEKNEGDKIIENSEVEINKNVVDLIKSLGYNIENDVKEKIDNKEEKEKENEQKKLEAHKNNENDKKGAVEDEKPEEGNDAKEGKKEEKEIKPNEEINGEKKDENKEENKEVKKDENKEEKKEEKKAENKEENKDDKKEENKEKKKDENKEVNTEEKKEENKGVKNDGIKPEIKDEIEEGKKDEIKEEKKGGVRPEGADEIEEEKKEEIKEVKNCENKEEKKDEIKPEKTDEIKEEKRDENNEDEKNKKSENEQKVEDKPQKEITVTSSEAKKEEINKNEKVENQEPKIDSTNLEKEIKEIEKLANPPKLSTIKKEESQGETSDLKLVNVISYDEKEDIKFKEKNNKNKKDAKIRKKSDIKNDLLNKNQSEEEPKEENLLNKKRYNDLKMLSSETKSNQDEVEEEPKNKENENVDENKKENENADENKKENENADESQKENEINTDSNKIQNQNDQANNETNAIINQENNNDNNINNNNNIQNQEINNLQMMQFQEMLFQKYLFEHGFENNFLNSYYQNTNKEEPDDGLPQIVNGKVKLQSDKPSLGLQNVGATCYMNATLQCLIHIKELSEQLLSAFFFKYPRDNENFAAKHKLSNKYVNLLSQVFFPTLNGNSTKYYAPYEFKTIISEINPLFAGYAANDAKDLLQCILENLHQELKQSTQMFYDYIIDQKNEQMGMQYFFNSYITQNKSPINDYLYGINEIKTTCSICKITKYNFQSYNLLYFPLKEAKRVTVLEKKEKDKNFDEENYILTLEDCFAHNQHIDHFTGDNKMYCNECKKEADADYQTVLFTTPTILSIVLNRGRANKDFQEDFKFGVELDIKEYIHNTAFKHGKYYLIGMVVHLGDSSLAGHFVAYCRLDKNSKWFLYNDAFVSEEEDIEAKFKENKPYILFYHYDNDNDVEQK